MKVEQLMTRDVQSCRREDTLDRAAQLMWDHDCGILPVLASDGATRTVGVVTDRDICMCALFQRKPLHELRVSDAMSKDLHSTRPGDSVGQAESIMREARVRRLPVTDEQGSLLGMISLADLAKEAARERDAPTQEVTETEIGDTLAAICQPSAPRAAA